jgi:SH3-like domain-containing protein
VRVAHNVEADFVEALPAGAQVTVLEGPITDGGETWLRVRAASGNEGWVRPSGAGEVYLA